MNRDEQKIKAANDYILERGYSTGQLDVAFIEGIEWADEHPNLTWEDIRDIINIFSQTNSFDAVFDVEKTCKEVLKRFKERKEK